MSGSSASRPCVVCLRDLSMRDDTADRRYWDKTLSGWAHVGCDTETMTPEERLLRDIFGEGGASKVREGMATQRMAADVGHVVSKTHRPEPCGDYTLDMVRLACSCGWESPWLNGAAIARAKRAHLKDAAIYERG